MRAEPASFNIVNAHHLLSQLLLEYRGCFGDALRDPLAACARLRAAVLGEHFLFEIVGLFSYGCWRCVGAGW